MLVNGVKRVPKKSFEVSIAADGGAAGVGAGAMVAESGAAGGVASGIEAGAAGDAQSSKRRLFAPSSGIALAESGKMSLLVLAHSVDAHPPTVAFCSVGGGDISALYRSKLWKTVVHVLMVRCRLCVAVG